MTRSVVFIAFALGSAAGILTGWLVWHETPSSALSTHPASALEKPSPLNKQRAEEDSPALTFREKPSPSPGYVSLDFRTLEALVPGQRADLNLKTLEKMGLSPEQIKAAQSEREQAMERFKKLESANSRIESGPEGEYVVIDPFPEALNTWLLEMQSNLRETIPDDRAIVVSRMIVLADNDELIGLHKREVFLRESTGANNNTRTVIEERTLAPDGTLKDTDFEAIADRLPKRWEHLLKNSTP